MLKSSQTHVILAPGFIFWPPQALAFTFNTQTHTHTNAPMHAHMCTYTNTCKIKIINLYKRMSLLQNLFTTGVGTTHANFIVATRFNDQRRKHNFSGTMQSTLL